MRFMGFMTSGDFGGNLNEFHGQSFAKLLEYPTRGKRCLFVSPDRGPACLYVGKLLRQMKIDVVTGVSHWWLWKDFK